jgi:hypothetical protein
MLFKHQYWDCRFVTDSGGQLPDFETGEPVTVALDPLQTALTTAQKLYKRRYFRFIELLHHLL